jgi:hypothetical protein
MLKRMLFAAAVTGLVAGVTIPVHSTPAEARSGCFKAAKEKFPGDFKARHAYRKECRAQYKAYRTAQKAAKKGAAG